MSKTKFYFVRHGETDRNALGKLPGRTNDPLNDLGKAQAKEVADAIKEVIHVAISSPLLRALETKEIICNKLSGEIISEDSDERISEVNFGELKGKTWEDAPAYHGDEDIKEKYRLQEYDFTSHGGDSFEVVKERLYKFIDDIKEKHSGKSILVVTHAGVIRCLYKAEKEHAFDRAPGHGEVHIFEF